mgnify:CR=1 FL=1
MALETQAPPECVHDASADDTPLQESPFVPVTEHETAPDVDQVTLVVPPEGTRRGEAVIEPVTTGLMQVLDPCKQNCGATQVVRFVVEQSALVCVIVCKPAPVQLHDCVQETVSVAPIPPGPVPEHCAVPPPGRVQEAV